MLSKILLTLTVIIAVVFYIKQKNRRQQKPEHEIEHDSDSLSPRTLAYILIGILVATAIALFGYKWHQDNQLLVLTITNDNGQSTQYNIKKKDMHGRSFTTLDGREVNLGAADRIEIATP